ncbi:MAG: hypothetical protein P1V51_22335 [Deltaproteobacteria bacterium]|nr:hypothetical protein [Deltaproteobacteria bacterium]
MCTGTGIATITDNRPEKEPPPTVDPVVEEARRASLEKSRRKYGLRATLLGSEPSIGEELGDRRTLIGS